MAWNFETGILISIVIVNVVTTMAQITDDVDGKPHQCQCSCSSGNNFLLATGTLRRQGTQANMDSITITDSRDKIIHRLNAPYRTVSKEVTDIERSRLDGLRDSAQRKNIGKLPTDMAVTVVDLFKKNSQSDNFTDLSQPSLGINNYPGNTNIQYYLQQQQKMIKQWQQNETKQHETNINKITQTTKNPKSGATDLRRLNTLIKSATKRLMEMFGKDTSPSVGLPNAGRSLADSLGSQQSFGKQTTAGDLSTRTLSPAKSKEPHGYWTEEKGYAVRNSANINKESLEGRRKMNGERGLKTVTDGTQRISSKPNVGASSPSSTKQNPSSASQKKLQSVVMGSNVKASTKELSTGSSTNVGSQTVQNRVNNQVDVSNKQTTIKAPTSNTGKVNVDTSRGSILNSNLKGQNVIGTEIRSISKPVEQGPMSEIGSLFQNQNIGNIPSPEMTADQLLKIIQAVAPTTSSNIYEPIGQAYTQPSTQSPIQPDPFAMAMMLGAWRKR